MTYGFVIENEVLSIVIEIRDHSLESHTAGMIVHTVVNYYECKILDSPNTFIVPVCWCSSFLRYDRVRIRTLITYGVHIA